MEQMPLVSVIISSYNQNEYLKVALNSVLSQTYNNIEIIIADDYSEDIASRQLILDYAGRFPDKVRYIFQPFNVGIAKNKNSAYKLAKGDFICLLDGDDFYLPEKIEFEMQLFKQRPELSVVYSNFMFVDKHGNFKKKWNNRPEKTMPEGNILREIINSDFPNSMNYNFELIRKDVFARHGYLDETLVMFEDWDFRIRYTQDSLVGYTGKVLSVYRRTENSISIKTSLSKKLDYNFKVINKNREVVEQSYKGAYLKFKQKNLVDHLFDLQMSLGKYVQLCFKIFLLYPQESITILRSFWYRTSNRKLN